MGVDMMIDELLVILMSFTRIHFEEVELSLQLLVYAFIVCEPL